MTRIRTKLLSTVQGYKIELQYFKPSCASYSSDSYILFAPNGEFIDQSIFYDELAAKRIEIITNS